MKKYIKPSIQCLEAETSTIMSISGEGNQADFGQIAGPSGASGGRSKRHTDTLWDETWESEDDDDK